MVAQEGVFDFPLTRTGGENGTNEAEFQAGLQEAAHP
jgi:hypothetical protein